MESALHSAHSTRFARRHLFAGNCGAQGPEHVTVFIALFLDKGRYRRIQSVVAIILQDLIEQGFLSEAVINFVALLGAFSTVISP